MRTYRDTEIVAPPMRGTPANPLIEDRSSGPGRLDGPLLRPEQAAELLAVKPSWVYDAVRTGRLPARGTPHPFHADDARKLAHRPVSASAQDP
jgi:hypothetical protein